MRLSKSLLATLLISPTLSKVTPALYETGRRIAGKPRKVIFYHRVADAWSWLLAQSLPHLIKEYDFELEIKVVSALPIDAVPDPERLDLYASYDAMRLARAWQLDFPDGVQSPAPALTRLAERIILGYPDNSLERLLVATAAVWSADSRRLAAMATAGTAISEQAAATRLLKNGRDLHRRGHYLGGTLWFQGEWFWGLDRLHFLEQRLRSCGANRTERSVSSQLFAPLQRQSAGGSLPLDLEYFFSFRSPYSYIGALRATSLADRLGLSLILRPLLPMILRGTPVPSRKLKYILRDTARIARNEKIAFGPLRDPLGKGIDRALAVFHQANVQSVGREFMLAAMRAIWTEAADLTCDKTMYRLALAAGLARHDVDQALGAVSWRAQVEANGAALAVLGLWGVPALCLRGPDDMPVSVAWGQDRMWAIERAALGVDVAMPPPRLVEKI